MNERSGSGTRPNRSFATSARNSRTDFWFSIVASKRNHASVQHTDSANMGQQIEQLAAFAAATRWEDVPEPIRTRVKHALLDTIGVILAGSLRPEVHGLRTRLLRSGGTGATVLAPGMHITDPRTAAMLNAIAGRSVELCDGLRGVQPSVQIVPGLMAVGEAMQSSGRDLLAAFLMGYEVAGRLAAGFTPRAFSHPNG